VISITIQQPLKFRQYKVDGLHFFMDMVTEGKVNNIPTGIES
jgi:hypothetical protein